MQLKSQHGGKMHPEVGVPPLVIIRQLHLSRKPQMRLRSTFPAMVLLPLSAIGYACICQTHQPVAAICAMLFIAGFSSLLVFFILNSLRAAEPFSTNRWIFTSTLAYIVDANTGRSSTAVAANSAYRGIIAFIAAEIAIPLQVSNCRCDRIILVAENVRRIGLEMVDCTFFGQACWSSWRYWS